MIEEQRLGNGFVRLTFPDGSHHDVAETRYSDFELRLIEAASFRRAGGPGRDSTGEAKRFASKYHGQRKN